MRCSLSGLPGSVVSFIWYIHGCDRDLCKPILDMILETNGYLSTANANKEFKNRPLEFKRSLFFGSTAEMHGSS